MPDINEIKHENDKEPLASCAETAPNSSKSRVWEEISEYVELIAFALLFVLIALTFFFRMCTIDGDSMKNTLHHGEKIVVSDLFYTPERGDIVVLHQTGERYNEPIVKRVIGLSGDTVTINHNTNLVTVTDSDGNTFELNEEDYVNITDNQLYHGITTYNVPEGCLFVLGDNRNESMDSRDMRNLGYVDSRRVLGKAIFRLMPFSNFGAIE